MSKREQINEAEFNAPEFNLHYEAKTKQWHCLVQGKNFATKWGTKDAEKLQSTVKHYDSEEEAIKHAAEAVHEKTTGKDKYKLVKSSGSKSEADLPKSEKKTKGSRKKKATEEGGAEDGGEAEAGKKRGRPSKKTEEKEEDSDAKKAKHAAGEDAGTKDVSAKSTEEVKMDTSEHKVGSPAKAAKEMAV